jgi:hypothetical protein
MMMMSTMRVLSASDPIQNAFVGSIALGRQLITSLLFRQQILKKGSDIAIVLNVHLARRKELRSLKGMAYLYNLPLISSGLLNMFIIGYE